MPVAAAPQFLADVGGTIDPSPAPPGWVWVAVPDLPDAIIALAAHFTIEFIEERP
jgi:hypothetical protein